MDTRYLRSFLRVAELGNVSRAAAALNVVQPALSRQIKLLEAELGTQLLVRHRRGVTLTAPGQLLKERAADILAQLEDARRIVSDSGREPSGSVSLGLPTSMLYVLSADLVTEFSSRFPRVSLRVHEALGHVVEDHLRGGQVDVAILISPSPIRGIGLTPLADERLYLAGPPDCDLDIRKPVKLERLAKLPIVMLSPRNKVRLIIEDLLQRKGLALAASLEVEGQPLALELVRRNVGYTVLPHCAVAAEMSAGRVRGAPIAGASFSWVLGIDNARAGAPAVKVLTTLLREIVLERISAGFFKTGKSGMTSR